MGSNDHFDQELYEAIERLVEEGLLDEDSDLHKIAMIVVEEGFLLPEEAAIYQRDIEPLLVQLGDYQRDDYLRHLFEKDD